MACTYLKSTFSLFFFLNADMDDQKQKKKKDTRTIKSFRRMTLPEPLYNMYQMKVHKDIPSSSNTFTV